MFFDAAYHIRVSTLLYPGSLYVGTFKRLVWFPESSCSRSPLHLTGYLCLIIGLLVQLKCSFTGQSVKEGSWLIIINSASTFNPRDFLSFVILYVFWYSLCGGLAAHLYFDSYTSKTYMLSSSKCIATFSRVINLCDSLKWFVGVKLSFICIL